MSENLVQRRCRIVARLESRDGRCKLRRDVTTIRESKTKMAIAYQESDGLIVRAIAQSG